MPAHLVPIFWGGGERLDLQNGGFVDMKMMIRSFVLMFFGLVKTVPPFLNPYHNYYAEEIEQ